ncbi:MAG TPA: hypothetical protein VIJ78_08430 [Pseudolabrys sp.]
MKSNMRWIFAAFLTLGCTAGLARAESIPATDPSIFTPIETPAINPDKWKTYQTPPSADGYKIKPSETGSGATAPLIPKGIDLGKSRIEFNANHTSAVTAPGGAIDSGETSNLSGSVPGKRQETAAPNYFGFTLSRPMH